MLKYSILVLALFLGSCTKNEPVEEYTEEVLVYPEPKFKFYQRAIIKSGFYEGVNGNIISYSYCENEYHEFVVCYKFNADFGLVRYDLDNLIEEDLLHPLKDSNEE